MRLAKERKANGEKHISTSAVADLLLSEASLRYGEIVYFPLEPAKLAELANFAAAQGLTIEEAVIEAVGEYLRVRHQALARAREQRQSLNPK